MIRAVTFDVGGTLIRPWPSVGHVYADEAARHGWHSLAPEVLNRNFLAAWRGRGNDFNHTEHDWKALVDRTFDGLVHPPPSRSFFPALYDRFARAEGWRAFDDAFPTLKQLQAANLRLLVISNWDEQLRPLLHELGLTSYFEDLLISVELGHTKPDAEIFLEAARRLQLHPSAMLHIGDDPEADTDGAHCAGFQARTVVRNLNRELGPHGIRSLSEVVRLIRTDSC